MTPCPSLPAQPQRVSTLFHAHSTVHVHCTFLLTFSMTPCPSLPAQPQWVSTLFHAHSTVHVHCTFLLTFSMTPCPSLPAQPQRVSTLFSCTFYCTCTLYISPHILHDTLSCTITVCKYFIFVHILLYYIHCISLLTSPMTPCPSLPAQPQDVSILFQYTFYCTWKYMCIAH